MKTPIILSSFIFILLAIISLLSAAAANNDDHEDFLECLSGRYHNSISNVTYTPTNSSYASILRFSIHNLRFTSQSTPRPQVIITPEHESQIPHVIHCARENDMEIRIRSGGHDYEGLSYVSQVSFVILDLINFSEITVDPKAKTAWVGSGATIGSLYYRIAERSSILGFPAGVCPTVGVGGHFSGGGYGTLLRKYGLAADNVIDARIVDASGRILDRRSMGEDLFWAIRGGGGSSFGVILAWQVKLVEVPEQVTVFTVSRTLEQNATLLVHRWQSIAHTFDPDLFIRILITRANSTQNDRNFTVRAAFNSIFLGGIDRLIPIMQRDFPELGLTREDCTEMSWIESILYFAGFPIESRDVLLNRTQPRVRYFKAKSDYVRRPIPERGLEGLWRIFYEPEGEDAELILSPYGGIMDNISESAIPFPHRARNLYKIQHLAWWQENNARNSHRYISWIRRLYSYMAPYVSSSPRAAYINYRDLDIGVNNNEGRIDYARASVWGRKYFGNNFDRLVRVKTAVDPDNFFRNEQKIVSIHRGFHPNKPVEIIPEILPSPNARPRITDHPFIAVNQGRPWGRASRATAQGPPRAHRF
ncbi:FAD-binding Berberine family protein [Striga hermonthica]|uniref:FAD-binding Berberine family protein n=1 Tax=Striga hermonthica TaxID=68872 RepID=A0A9N7N9E0_STRHE|nr:FAD-binding Berberine family protein [Striga hermonthica]